MVGVSQDEKALAPVEAAAFCGLHIATFWKKVKEGIIPFLDLTSEGSRKVCYRFLKSEMREALKGRPENIPDSALVGYEKNLEE